MIWWNRIYWHFLFFFVTKNLSENPTALQAAGSPEPRVGRSVPNTLDAPSKAGKPAKIMADLNHDSRGWYDAAMFSRWWKQGVSIYPPPGKQVFFVITIWVYYDDNLGPRKCIKETWNSKATKARILYIHPLKFQQQHPSENRPFAPKGKYNSIPTIPFFGCFCC